MTTAHATVARKMALAFAVPLLSLVALAAVAIWALRVQSAQVNRVVDVYQAKAEAAQRLQVDILEMGLSGRSVALLTDVKSVDAEAALVREAQARYEATVAQLRSLAETDAERQQVDALKPLAAQAMQALAQAVKEGQDGAGPEATLTLTQRVAPAEATWRKAVAALSVQASSQAEAARSGLHALGRKVVWAVLALGLLAVVAGSVLAWRLATQVSRPVARASLVASRVEAGDLSSSFVQESDDELGRMLAGLARMQTQLRGVIGEINAAAHQIQTASTEVAVGNQDLSTRTEHTASQLQQTAGALETLTEALRATSEAVASASALAQDTATLAGEGGQQVLQVVQTMQQIDQSAKRIHDIIGTIDGIAFQTNILALNAAVEAARAGESGRGFAVVAGEVRLLARRSAEAGRESKTLIQHSVERVDEGSRLVNAAGVSIERVVGSVQALSQQVSTISRGAQEQRSGIEVVNRTVSELDQATQQNAALVEQSAAAAESLKDQAQRLSGLVGRFVLRREDR